MMTELMIWLSLAALYALPFLLLTAWLEKDLDK